MTTQPRHPDESQDPFGAASAGVTQGPANRVLSLHCADHAYSFRARAEWMLTFVSMTSPRGLPCRALAVEDR